jgi:hypothetical protein
MYLVVLSGALLAYFVVYCFHTFFPLAISCPEDGEDVKVKMLKVKVTLESQKLT